MDNEPPVDTNKIDDAVLALLYLGSWTEKGGPGAETWKGFDWDAMGRLHEKGFISDPVGKAKSVYMTDQGFERSRELFYKLFGASN